MTGIITDMTVADPVPGAVVEARIAADESVPPIAGAVVGPDGRYSLGRLPGVSYVRVTAYGYLKATQRVELTADGTRHFSIVPDPSLDSDLAGSYTLTIETDDACPSAPSPLAPNLRRRIFPARMQQVGVRLTVEVDSPFDLSVFAGRASASGATFWLKEGTSPLDGTPKLDLAESIPTKGQFANPRLWFLGTATTNRSATGLLGSLDGTIIYHLIECSPCIPVPTASCSAGRFELTR